MASSRDKPRAGRRRGSDAEGDGHAWTFLSNYAHVLVCIARDPDLTVREIADHVGITERATHRLVTELEAAGVATRHREGRRNHYEVDVTMPLRHPLEHQRTVGDLLVALLDRSEAAALGLCPSRRSG
ncbi:MAG: winged helix-turn-helix domain-containing protein [Deltaproteobacteria bacterium]|nr:winged helix-turn-helix domain-containing protein [Deltaproteobacteria bacterium]